MKATGMRWIWWSTAIAVISLSACATSKVGQQFDDRTVKSIRIGKTTRADIAQMFGQPLSRSSTGGGKEVWAYHYQEAGGHPTPITFVPIVGMFAGGAKGTFNQQTLTISFDGDVVSACTYHKTSSDVTTSAMGLSSSSATDRLSSVSTPCDEVQ